jgi:anthranilate synthase component 1
VAHIQVGAGIVADSDPPTEYQETINKANATLAAVAEAERMEALSRPSAKKLEVVA